MTGTGNEVPRSARRLVLRALLLAWLGTLVCVLLAFAWLQIADSHLWQFAFSMLSGALLVFAFCWVQTRVFQDLRQSPALAPLWMRLLGFLLLLGLWLMLLSWIGIARDHAPLYAGYWNSKLSPELRYLATYERLVSWQQFFWSLLQWLVAALLLPIAVEGSTFGFGRGRMDAHWPRLPSSVLLARCSPLRLSRQCIRRSHGELAARQGAGGRDD